MHFKQPPVNFVGNKEVSVTFSVLVEEIGIKR